jgi:hypothetical protein
MSIADRITSMSNNLSSAYGRIAYLGVDLSEVDKNIQNLSTVLDTVYNDYPKVSDEGISPSLDGTKVGRLNTTLKGNTSQDGTPTPNSPVDINVVRGENSITVSDGDSESEIYPITLPITNLFTKTNIIENYRLDTGGANFSHTGYFISDYIEVEASTNYIVNYTPTVYTRICYYNSSKNFLSKNDANATFTTPANTKYIRFCNLLTNIDFVRLERGNVIKGDMELCKAGDYQDYIYGWVDNWYLYKAIKKTVLDGSENWNNETTKELTQVFSHFENGLLSGSYVFSDRFQYGVAGDTEKITTASGSISTLYIAVLKSRATNSTEFKTWLSSNNTTVYYVLVTPTTTQITDTTLISQLNALYNAMSYNGETNILQTNADLPFIISASALKGE